MPYDEMQSNERPAAPMMQGTPAPVSEAMTFDAAVQLLETSPEDGMEMLKMLLSGMGQPLTPEEAQMAQQILASAGGQS